MNKFASLTGALVILGLTGCMSTSPHWDARFGEAARTVAAQQAIDPGASHNADPVTGIDGKAAQGAMGEYAKSYTQPQPQPDVFTIGVGSGGSGR
ncbi:pilus assembly protein [Aromatoleum bremense]|uniref:Pilus assembly protein n=1 Tax=Aromatoleum bremense TaxID=76115 RepID=A0ABX1NTF0_9RHOO|nr:pilus assembly protein [Aromatoleum bremense]NMG15033.1 pilus assembly protein [Aromatoleum bremense]QTQ32259.1 Uncharacterized protein pbN1_22690 [Aromatoleum bremense]